MTRSLVALLFLALAASGGFLAYEAAARESEYRRLITRGEEALGSDDTFVAIEAFSGALALKGDSLPAYLRLGEAYRRQGELGTALRHLREAARIDPSAPRPLELLGDVNYAMERYVRAVESYQACLVLDDRSAAVQYKLALSLYRRGDPAAAVAPLGLAVALDPDFAEAHALLGLCLGDLDQVPEAITASEQAVRLAPGLLAPRETLASLYRRNGDERRAVEALDALAALEPDRPGRLVAVARAHARMGRTDLAVVTLGRAADRYPNDPQVFLELGRTWLNTAETGRDRVALSKALEALDRAARGPSATSEGLTLLGRALMLSGDLPEALRILQQATTRFPVDPSAFLHLSSAALRSARPDLAREALIRHLALSASNADLERLAPQIADLSLRLGKMADAVQWLTRSLESSGETAAGLARLADAQIRTGDLEAARGTVERGLARYPQHAALLTLSRRLSS